MRQLILDTILRKYHRLYIFLVFITAIIFFFKEEGKQVSSGDDHVPVIPIFTSEHYYNNDFSDADFGSFENKFSYYLKRWGIKGASLAVAKDGEIVYAKGFGYANIDDSTEVEPYNQFRIASVSKLVTATAIMKMVEEGKLSLDSKVFGVNGILNDSIYLNYRDKRCGMITVRHLLEHSGGWSPRYGDPMFMPWILARRMKKELPISNEDIISYILTRRLHFTPGKASVYSNLGFTILGKVIEKVSGQNYESYVKSQVLNPIGLFDMQIANNRKEKKAAYEVNYYELPDALKVPSFDGKSNAALKCDGGTDVHELEAAGGWIASATDLLKLSLAIDGFENVPDILQENSIQAMVARKVGYSPLGWRKISYDNSWIRTGTLAGTSAVMVRRDDGITFVVLCNTSAWTGPGFAFDMSNFITKGIRRTPLLVSK